MRAARPALRRVDEVAVWRITGIDSGTHEAAAQAATDARHDATSAVGMAAATLQRGIGPSPLEVTDTMPDIGQPLKQILRVRERVAA
jgi:hypothetical protein